LVGRQQGKRPAEKKKMVSMIGAQLGNRKYKESITGKGWKKKKLRSKRAQALVKF